MLMERAILIINNRFKLIFKEKMHNFFSLFKNWSNVSEMFLENIYVFFTIRFLSNTIFFLHKQLIKH